MTFVQLDNNTGAEELLSRLDKDNLKTKFEEFIKTDKHGDHSLARKKYNERLARDEEYYENNLHAVTHVKVRHPNNVRNNLSKILVWGWGVDRDDPPTL